ncbi:MAG: family 31 glycosyl hydrolase [Mesotoga infera]|uniref:Family 31 glycosyl hydrolase n=1 Tax=Mesotoga infera TaxID=1236046 RepID=A0A101I7E5_9BACT|nr:MAG: family 31 glycosyl hydrolase [Mesotoga infera]
MEERAEFDLYEDDGFTYAYETGEYSIKKLVVTNTHDGIRIEVRPQKGTFICKERMLSFKIYNGSGLHEAKIPDSPAGCEILVE